MNEVACVEVGPLQVKQRCLEQLTSFQRTVWYLLSKLRSFFKQQTVRCCSLARPSSLPALGAPRWIKEGSWCMVSLKWVRENRRDFNLMCVLSSGCKSLSERLVWQPSVAMLEIGTSSSDLLIAFAFSLKHFDMSLIAGSKEPSAGFLLRHARKRNLSFGRKRRVAATEKTSPVKFPPSITLFLKTLSPFIWYGEPELRLEGGGQRAWAGVEPASGTRGSPYSTSLSPFHPCWKRDLVPWLHTQRMFWSWLISESISHTFVLCPHFRLAGSSCSSLQAELEMLLSLKVDWLKLDPLGELLPLHADPADFIGGMEGSSRTSGRASPLRVTCGSVSCLPPELSAQCLLLEWMLLNQRVDESVKTRFSWQKTSGFKMLFGPETFEQTKQNEGVLSVQSGSSLKTCAVCYRQLDEAFKPAFKARTALTLVSMCHQQCCNFHVLMGQSPVTRPFVLNLLFHTNVPQYIKKKINSWS